MVMLAPPPAHDHASSHEQRTSAMVNYLRSVVLTPPALHERGDAAFGMGSLGTLHLRMRALFGEALRLGASGLILAHNHPSGQCQPSGSDLTATRQLQDVARALDITLIDHLIFTNRAVYSMRAGGLL